MARTPSGTISSVVTAFAASKNITAITNAAEAVATCTAHGLLVGDIVVVQSGWSRLHRRSFRVKAVPTADTFTLEQADTSNTTLYPAGGGAGSMVKATTWVQLSSTINHSSSGGGAKKVSYKFIESDVEYSLNDGFSAVDRAFDIDADAISTPGYLALRQLTEVQTDTIMRKVAKSGAISLLPCTITLNEEEVDQGGIMVCRVSVSGNARSTRYAA